MSTTFVTSVRLVFISIVTRCCYHVMPDGREEWAEEPSEEDTISEHRQSRKRQVKKYYKITSEFPVVFQRLTNYNVIVSTFLAWGNAICYCCTIFISSYTFTDQRINKLFDQLG